MIFDPVQAASAPVPAWSRRPRYRSRLTFTLVVLIGISTPSATSAPNEDALVTAPAPAATASVFDQPQAIVVLGAAMLTIAAMLRRAASRGKLHG